jgi:hypothetical protein
VEAFVLLLVRALTAPSRDSSVERFAARDPPIRYDEAAVPCCDVAVDGHPEHLIVISASVAVFLSNNLPFIADTPSIPPTLVVVAF